MSEPIVGTRRGEPSVGFHRISLPERRQGSKRSEGSNKFLGGSLGYREYGRRDKYHANSSEKLDAISPQRSRSWLQLRLASGEKLLSWLHQYRVRDLLQIGLSPDKNIHLRNQNLCLWGDFLIQFSFDADATRVVQRIISENQASAAPGRIRESYWPTRPLGAPLLITVWRRTRASDHFCQRW
jgi:hypothetical protein